MKKKLSSRFMLAIVIPVVLIMVYHLFLLNWLSGYNRQKLNATNGNAAASMAQSLGLALGNIGNAAKTFTYSHAVQSMAAGETEVNPVSINNMLMMAQSYNPDMMDVMLTDGNGVTHSLKGYLTSSVERQAKSLAYSHFSEQKTASFAFFTAGKTDARYLLYSAPVFATHVASHFGQRVGSISILCGTSGLLDTLRTAKSIRAFLVDSETQASLLGAGGMEQQGFVYTKEVPGTSLELQYTAAEATMDDESRFFVRTVWLSVAITLVLCVYLAGVVHRLFLRPIVHMNNEISQLDSADTTARLKNIPANEIGSIGVHVNGLLDTLHALNNSVAKSRERLYQMDILKKKTQLYAYQSQINPHFLYNMLQCMRGIALSHDMNEIADICTSMAAIFRYSIKGEGRVPLETELHMTDLYLNMLRLRFQDKIQYTIDVDPCFGACLISKLTLQPLVENAVFHGLAPLGYEGRVDITAQRQGQQLWLRIYNDGAGIEPGVLADLQRQLEEPVQNEMGSESDAHIGIINVHNKIRLYEGMEYGLSIDSGPQSTTVTVKLPLQKQGEAALQSTDI